MYVPPEGPPATDMPSPIIYQVLGEDGIKRLIRAFYRQLSVSPIANMFPADEAALMAAADNSALFWITVCGGPPLYAEKHGPPMMRKRHFRFRITDAARNHWLACWDSVLANATVDFGFPAQALPGFRAWVEAFSAWMVNTED